MLIARVFSLFAGDPSQVALSVNILSALSSSFTILFLFWSVTHLALKMIKKASEISLAEGLTILGAGTVGALVYTFSDSFWFSAVEGEVYAMSSLFTALVFWAILKWESQADDPSSLRWIVFIAFLMGPTAELNMRAVLGKRLTITGSTLRPQSVEEKAEIAKNLMRDVMPLLETGAVKPIVYRSFPLADASRAHELMESSRHMGKIVLDVAEHAGD